jgi:hypothetical protein
LKFGHWDLKNPFQSAQSAQSVLPLYLYFPNEKLLYWRKDSAYSFDNQEHILNQEYYFKGKPKAKSFSTGIPDVSE